MLEIYYLLTPEAAERVRRTWAWTFRRDALTLIDEESFRVMYHETLGTPNKSIRMLVGTLILKEMFDCTDVETVENLSFNLLWHVALGLKSSDAYCCQKTLHNFRVNLIRHDLGMLVFKNTADQIAAILGIDTSRQRLDSTHCLSNIAVLTRLGLFCETIRLFLREVQKHAKSEFEKIPISWRERYIKDDGDSSSYDDAKPSKARRRLNVCARDLWRLLDRFKGDKEIAELESYTLLKRLFDEQCEAKPEKEAAAPEAEDDDHGEKPVPVNVKANKDVASDSLQTPHDPDVTYSGHKGKGYSVQIMETCHNEGKPEILTEAETEPACQSDQQATIPLLKDLDERDILPGECYADTGYGSTENVIEGQKLGVEIVSPLAGRKVDPPEDDAVTVGDFDVAFAGEQPITCPAGHPAVAEAGDAEKGTIEVTFATEHCAVCALSDRCPARELSDGGRVLKTTVQEYTVASRRRYEATDEFEQRYKIRAGVEATNSEMKRGHGLGKMRVRGHPRVRLAVYLKATACNMKRMVKYLQKQAQIVEVTA
jgi:hypothetical protein